MRRGITCTVAFALLGIASASHAQRPTGSAVLEGTVQDSASGRPVPRAQVCALVPSGPSTFWSRCAPVDTSTAAYRLDSLPAGRLAISVGCSTVQLFGSHTLGHDSIAVSDSAVGRRDWRVSTTGCDPRPLRRVTGTFRGYYTPGFESSEFVPCAADAWFVAGDSLRTEPFNERRAWASLRRGSLPKGFAWPEAPTDDFGNPTYYVQWRGIIVGPGHYGHMGVSPFEIQVDTVLVLRAPRSGDCGAIS